MSALDELLNRWRKNPDADATIALCSHLGVSARRDLMDEVAGGAMTRHGGDAEVMLAVGRMYLDASLFAESQAALVAGGKANPAHGPVFRFLGEVLLRRGDAERASKVLARAAELGVTEFDIGLWQERAQIYMPLQKRKGGEAVAKEVARSHPPRPSIAPPAPAGGEPDSLLGDILGPGANSAATTARGAAGAYPPPAAFQELSLRERAEAAVALRDSTEEVTGDLRPSDPLPSFASSSHDIEPPTVPGNLYYPRSVPGYAPGEPASAVAHSMGQEAQEAGVPKPSLVLQHLARVGLFEPAGAVRPAWEQAPKQKTRGSWVLILATVLVAAAGTGGYYYARHVKAQRLAHATALNEEVTVMLNTGNLEKIRATDDKLTEAFELDSLSKKAARLWLQNRVLNLLLAPGESTGIDSASHRAKQVELPPEDYAFGKVASFLSEGDLAGAAALLPKWDKRAGKDAYYQLTGGAVLERAGDLRAIERYEAARALDKKLLPADLLLARLVLLEVGPEKAKPVIESFEKKGGEEVSVRALRALSWAVDRDRPNALPDDAQINRSVENQLAVPLRPIVYVVDALKSIEVDEYEQASKAIEEGVARSLTPAMATRFGFLAIQADDEKLARKAALRALKFSAVYPGARVLAARVALLGGRLDEAQKAIEQLDPDSMEVAVVRAVVGYETFDDSSLSSAVESFGDDKDRFELSALAAGTGVMLGTSYPQLDALEKMAQPQVPWGQLVAVDAALAQGELELAQKLVKPWPSEVVRPVFSLRLARLHRYLGNKERALEESERALLTPNAPAVIERVLTLLESDNAKEARSVVARYPALLGTAKDWLNILIDAAEGQEKRAKATAASLEFPPDATPLLIRLLATRAFVVAHDKRAKQFYLGMRRAAKKHPEVEALSELL